MHDFFFVSFDNSFFFLSVFNIRYSGKQLDYLEKLYAISSNPKIASDCFSILKQKLEKYSTEVDPETVQQLEKEKRIEIETIDSNTEEINKEIETKKENRQLLLKYLGKIWLRHEFENQTSDNNLVRITNLRNFIDFIFIYLIVINDDDDLFIDCY